MNHRIAELVEYLDGTRTALLEVVATVPPDRFTERPIPGRWSAAELVSHVAQIESGCARVIARRAAEARQGGVRAEQEDSSELGALDGRGVLDRSKPLRAPELPVPAGGFSRQQALDAIAASRLTLERAIADADGLALGEVRHQHAVLGEIDLYQWILFVGQHELRHRLQLQEIVAQLGATPP